MTIKYMPTINLSEFKILIEDKLKELRKEDELGKVSQQIVELDQQSVGRLSRMDALQSQAMAQAQKRRRNAMQVVLQAALKRIDEGEFGFCDDLMDCGDKVSSLAVSFLQTCATSNEYACHGSNSPDI